MVFEHGFRTCLATPVMEIAPCLCILKCPCLMSLKEATEIMANLRNPAKETSSKLVSVNNPIDTLKHLKDYEGVLY